MRRAVRFAVLAAAGVLALAFAGSALAAYTPRINVLHVPPRLGGSSVTLLEFSTDRNDEATAKITFYVPPGYQSNFSQAPGTRIGEVEAEVQARAQSPDIFIPVVGFILIANPADPTIAGASMACTGTATHQAFLVLELTAGGQTLRVPMFVDAAAGPETGFASLKLTVCLPPPEGPGAAAFGAKVVDALLTFNAGIFTTPTTRGTFVWLGYATPYTGFRLPPNAPGTIQARALVFLPVTLTVRVTYNKKTKRAVVSGRLTLAGDPGAGLRVDVYSAATPAALRRKVVSPEGRPSARPVVRRNGTFSASLRIRGRTYFQVVFVFVQTADQAGCAVAVPAPPGPGGCTATANALFISRVVNTRPPRRR